MSKIAPACLELLEHSAGYHDYVDIRKQQSEHVVYDKDAASSQNEIRNERYGHYPRSPVKTAPSSIPRQHKRTFTVSVPYTGLRFTSAGR